MNFARSKMWEMMDCTGTLSDDCRNDDHYLATCKWIATHSGLQCTFERTITARKKTSDMKKATNKCLFLFLIGITIIPKDHIPH